MIKVSQEYRTSIGKWRIIRKFAEINNLDSELISRIDAMIARIREKGNAELDDAATLTISTEYDLFASIKSQKVAPCPHCVEHRSYCGDCELHDDSGGSCCSEWVSIRMYLREWLGFGLYP